MSELTNVHKSVLLHETIDGLDFHEGDIFLDGTLGGAGHAEVVADKFKDSIFIIGLDMDADALERGEKALSKHTKHFLLRQENFRNLDKVIDEAGKGEVTKILLDLGLSSNQLELTERGFSFQKNEPLIMTFRKETGTSDLTAKEIVNTWDEENIADIIYGYGEEGFSRKIAHAICLARETKEIETTFELTKIITDATPNWYHHRKSHPATKTFQALRIAVNDELRALTEGMTKGYENLAVGGKMAIISFHSLEDRLVKHFYKAKKEEDNAEITKKPIEASEEERKTNPRSRSAKLRIITKTQ